MARRWRGGGKDSTGESNEGRTVDALALTGDEGRDKLRKAAVRRK